MSTLPVFNKGEFSFNGSIGYLRKIRRSENVDFSFVSSFIYGFTPVTNITAVNAGTQIEVKLGRYLMLECRAGVLVGKTTLENDFINRVTPSLGVALMYNFVQ